MRALLRRTQADQELEEELRDHLERKEEYVAQGMTQEQAHRRARLDLAGIDQTKEKCRDARRVNWIQDFVQGLLEAEGSIRSRAATEGTIQIAEHAKVPISLSAAIPTGS
jgi:hypothetical protein